MKPCIKEPSPVCMLYMPTPVLCDPPTCRPNIDICDLTLCSTYIKQQTNSFDFIDN